MIAYKVSENAKILFVGINPHPGSYRRGVPFSNNKMFWYLLNRSGLLQEEEAHLKDDLLLKRIYDEKFLDFYQLNFVNLVDRPTIDVTELKKGEDRPESDEFCESSAPARQRWFASSERSPGILITAAGNAIGAGSRRSPARKCI